MPPAARVGTGSSRGSGPGGGRTGWPGFCQRQRGRREGVLKKSKPLAKNNRLLDPRSRGLTLTLTAISIGMLLALGIGSALGLRSVEVMQEIVTRQFNEEQLYIARNIRDAIEREMALICKEALWLGREAARGPYSMERLEEVARLGMVTLLEFGVQELQMVDRRAGRVFSYMLASREKARTEYAPQRYAFIDFAASRKRGIWTSSPIAEEPGMPMYLVIALAERGDAYLICLINTAWFLRPLVVNIRSGATGYAWIIDQEGRFLYHQEASFIGLDAVAARKAKNPDLSYEEINRIMHEEMLKPREGVGVYQSGWHRGITGQLPKLLAFTPVRVSDDPYQFWSVAVVAPSNEVSDKVRLAHVWAFATQLLLMVVVLMAGIVLFWFERRWSQHLERRVEERTVELRRSEEKYRLLLESAEDYILVVDENWTVQSINSYTARFFGGQPQEFAGRHFASLFPGGGAEKQLRLLARVFHLGRSERNEFEWDVGGHEAWVDLHFMPLKDDTGRVTRVLCIARDITERKRLERNLVNTEKLASLGTLATGVAHEVNNPLGVILGFVEILLGKVEPGSRMHEDLKIIERQGLHCKEVVENLLSTARIEETDLNRCDIVTCLRETMRVVRHSLEMKDIALVETYEEGLGHVRGDPRRLQQVFINLVNNAASAIGRRGSITVRAYRTRRPRTLAVDIRDTGPGIPPEHMSLIFEPFFTTKPAGEGTGLGLFVSHGIISRFGGAIECFSRTDDLPGQPAGTTFTVYLQETWEDE